LEYDSLDRIKEKAEGLRNLIKLNHQRLRSQYGDEVTGSQSGNASGNWGAPPPASSSTQQTKTIGGKTYVNRNGQWYAQ